VERADSFPGRKAPRMRHAFALEHDPEKPALGVIRGGYRFSEKIMLKQ
jgi:hypothetical protein